MDSKKRKKREPLNLNMKILRRSRKPVQPGDVFVLQILADQFHFGRVIQTDINMMGKNVLVYIYHETNSDKRQIPVLDRQDLLVPPLIVGKFMWTRGYFETVSHRALSSEDVLPVHCFWTPSLLDPTKIKYFDEDGKELRERVEPCGFHALSLEGSVDNQISDALGIPRCAASLAADKEREEGKKKALARFERTVKAMTKKPELLKWYHEKGLIEHYMKTPELAGILRKYGIVKSDE